MPAPIDIQRAVGGPAHDSALRRAVDELRPRFHQCLRCGTWVCGDVCWNDGREQCVQCSPRMDREIKAIESEATVYQIRNKAMNDEGMAGGVKLQSAAASALCPSCQSPIEPGKRFCGECGANLAAKPKCPQCGPEAEPGKKFCAECGAKL